MKVVVLPKVDAALLGGFDQSLPGAVVESRIGRVANFLLLNRGVHVHPFELIRFDDLEPKPGLDGFLEQLFRPASPVRLRNFVMLDGSIGRLCSKYWLPQK